MISGVGQETKAFPDVLAVPVIAGLATPGCDDLVAGGLGGVNAIERHLNRSWPLFGQTYYYGDYNQNPPNDPATVTTALSPYGKWAPFNPSQDYVYYDGTGKWGPAGGTGGTGNAYPIQVSGYADGCASGAAGLTVAEQIKCHSCITAKGYYLHDGATAGDLTKSVFHGTILNDYPPAWVHFAWAFGYILNFQLHDASNNPIFPIVRDTSQSSNGSGSSCSTSNIQHTGGNFEPVGSSNCGIAYPTFNWPAVQALGLSGVYNDQSNVEGGNSAWGSDGASATPAGDIVAAGAWVDSFVNTACKFCQTKSVLYIGFGQPCGEQRPAGLPVQTMAACGGDCTYVNPACSSCSGQANFIAEAAHFIYTTKNVRTYFIGMGQHTTAMRRAAAEGHGKYFDGRDAKSFHDSFFAILIDLLGQASSSATSTVNAVQVSVAGQQELVPRFVARQNQGLWEGHLFKYFLFSEFAASCSKAGDVVPVPNPQQPVCNATCVCPGGSCGGRWLVDGQCNLIAADQTGFLYQATWNGTALIVPQPAACVTNTDCGGLTCNPFTKTCPPTAKPAVPVWDSNAQMQLTPWNQRNVYTAIDTNGDGLINASDGDGTSPAGMYKITASATAGVADLTGGVSDAVADALAPYMAIDGTTTCTDVENALGIALPGAAAVRLRACARVILNYALGEDLFNEQQLLVSDPNYTVSNRLTMLGDVFHSSPQDIGPPASERDCVTNTRRCVTTLFNNSTLISDNHLNNTSWQALDLPDKVIALATDPGLPATGSTITNPGNVYAYEAYYRNETFALKRPHVSLFGANDGMVHAVQTSCYVDSAIVTTFAGTAVVPNYWDGAGTGTCIGGSKSNGSELWAFIPPDLLPKLAQILLGKHQIFADNSPMVRDIYSPSGTQSPKKRYTIGATPVPDFKRIAIFGERDGGTRWFGLDVTDPAAPQFRWIFPQPNTADELSVGQSWGDWVPNAPPVVPVRLAAPTGLGTFPSYTNSDLTVSQFQEKWVVLLPGGHDPYGAVGKHMYMLDAYTGAKIFQTNDYASVKQDFPFAALPAAIPWGTSEVVAGSPTYNNGFFDTAVYGDEGGQVWTARFNDVGKGYTSTSIVNNWFFARSFREFAGDDTGVSPYKMQHRTPFFQMAAAARMNEGPLRAFLGSGDRANAAESGVGMCSMYNPAACGKLKCTMTLAENLSLNGNPQVNGASSYDGSINATYSTSWSETFTAGSAACSPAYQEINACVSCPGGTAAATNPAPSEPQYSCTNTSTGWKCAVMGISETIAAARLEATTVMPTPNPNSDIGYFSRFLALNVFDTNLLTPRAIFTNATTASTYDGRALTEAPAATAPASITAGTIPNLFYANASKTFSPVGNVTVNATVSGASPGYYFYYPVLDERTATNSVLAQNCVSWYSMEPGQECLVDGDCSGGTCNTTTHVCTAPTACGSSATAIPARSAFLYQINASDGSSNCGLTSSSYLRTAAPLNAFLVPPPPPQQLISQNSKGQLQYSIIAPAGQLSPPAASGIGGASTPFSFYYTIGLPRETEICRHQYNANACYP
jgi:type IV pilus assembly protein PilY1